MLVMRRFTAPVSIDNLFVDGVNVYSSPFAII
jgi:hypothetical protein